MQGIEKNCGSQVAENVMRNSVSVGACDVDADTRRFNIFCDKGYMSPPKMFVGALDSNGNHYRFTKRGENK